MIDKTRQKTTGKGAANFPFDSLLKKSNNSTQESFGEAFHKSERERNSGFGE
jgi:hypothetical protein